jgi:hypothetical protein
MRGEKAALQHLEYCKIRKNEGKKHFFDEKLAYISFFLYFCTL